MSAYPDPLYASQVSTGVIRVFRTQRAVKRKRKRELVARVLERADEDATVLAVPTAVAVDAVALLKRADAIDWYDEEWWLLMECRGRRVMAR